LTWVAAITGQSSEIKTIKSGLQGAADAASGLHVLMDAVQPLFVQAKHLVHFDQAKAGEPSLSSVVADARKTIGQVTEQLERSRLALTAPASAKVAGISTSQGEGQGPGSWAGTLSNRG